VKKQQKFFLIFFLTTSWLFYGAAGFAVATDGCVACHTNESLMKSLHKPPPIPVGQGEG